MSSQIANSNTDVLVTFGRNEACKITNENNIKESSNMVESNIPKNIEIVTFDEIIESSIIDVEKVIEKSSDSQQKLLNMVFPANISDSLVFNSFNDSDIRGYDETEDSINIMNEAFNDNSYDDVIESSLIEEQFNLNSKNGE